MRHKKTPFRLILAIMLVLVIASGGTAALAAPAPLAPSMTAAITVDGSMDVAEGYYRATLQNTPTGFGDNTEPVYNIANGSELDGAYYMMDSTDLYIMLTGNLETNFNKLDIFIDSMAGGQNQLLGGDVNPDIDYGGLRNMSGLMFDTGFEADYFLTITNNNSGDGMESYANFAGTPTGGGGTGESLGGGAGTVVTGTNGIMVAIDNSNIAGVFTDTLGFPISVTTGIEIQIPLSVIGSPTGNVKVSAFINNSGHTYLSNQVLGGIGGGANLGNPGQRGLLRHRRGAVLHGHASGGPHFLLGSSSPNILKGPAATRPSRSSTARAQR